MPYGDAPLGLLLVCVCERDSGLCDSVCARACEMCQALRVRGPSSCTGQKTSSRCLSPLNCAYGIFGCLRTDLSPDLPRRSAAWEEARGTRVRLRQAVLSRSRHTSDTHAYLPPCPRCTRTWTRVDRARQGAVRRPLSRSRLAPLWPWPPPSGETVQVREGSTALAARRVSAVCCMVGTVSTPLLSRYWHVFF